MDTKGILCVVLIHLLLCARAAPMQGVPDGADLPEFSHEAPAKGLKALCTLPGQTFEVGQQIHANFTITNVSDATRPIAWRPQGSSQFHLLREGPELHGEPVSSCTAYPPVIQTPIFIESAGGEPNQYALYLPPSSSMAFVVQLPLPTSPGRFEGRVLFNPLPESGVHKRGGEVTVIWTSEPDLNDDRFVISNVIECTVLEGNHPSDTRLKEGAP